MTAQQNRPGHAAVVARGWFGANKWLFLRRTSQALVLGLFLLGPLAGIWVVKGNLTSSMTLDVLPLTDPYVLLQTLVSGHWPELTALAGATIVLVFYLLIGGRVYCAWVCPVNVITDSAHWLRERLGITGGLQIPRAMRYWILLLTLLLAMFTGTIAWELVNPVTIVHRGLVYGMGFAWVVVAGIFLLDLLVSRRAWCGHLCPVGAFYSLLGHVTPLRVTAVNRRSCDDCMDCFAVCPEPQVIPPALKGAAGGAGPVILAANCTNCGRCIDVCAKDVFEFGSRFKNHSGSSHSQSLPEKMEVIS